MANLGRGKAVVMVEDQEGGNVGCRIDGRGNHKKTIIKLFFIIYVHIPLGWVIQKEIILISLLHIQVS